MAEDLRNKSNLAESSSKILIVTELGRKSTPALHPSRSGYSTITDQTTETAHTETTTDKQTQESKSPQKERRVSGKKDPLSSRKGSAASKNISVGPQKEQGTPQKDTSSLKKEHGSERRRSIGQKTASSKPKPANTTVAVTQPSSNHQPVRRPSKPLQQTGPTSHERPSHLPSSQIARTLIQRAVKVLDAATQTDFEKQRPRQGSADISQPIRKLSGGSKRGGSIHPLGEESARFSRYSQNSTQDFRKKPTRAPSAGSEDWIPLRRGTFGASTSYAQHRGDLPTIPSKGVTTDSGSVSSRLIHSSDVSHPYKIPPDELRKYLHEEDKTLLVRWTLFICIGLLVAAVLLVAGLIISFWAVFLQGNSNSQNQEQERGSFMESTTSGNG